VSQHRRVLAAPAGVVCLVAVLVSLPAAAEVKQSAPDAFLVAHELQVGAAPSAVFAALGQVGRWWSPQHSWSGSPANMSLELAAGGCFCERWGEGGAEHARVLFVVRDRELRLRGALGPLQGMGLDGVLSFALAPAAEGKATRLAVTYRVTGDSLHGLAPLAPVVDGVVGEQVGRLKAFVETGSPEPAAPQP
jgi:uncharacterized protein YndB with AHSA1/START domain